MGLRKKEDIPGEPEMSIDEMQMQFNPRIDVNLLRASIIDLLWTYAPRNMTLRDAELVEEKIFNLIQGDSTGIRGRDKEGKHLSRVQLIGGIGGR